MVFTHSPLSNYRRQAKCIIQSKATPKFIDYVQHLLSKETYIQVQLRIQTTEHRQGHQIRQRMHLIRKSG
jgi:hypothetical protein